jgi:mono/diheme cytochrome c family protein
MTPRTRLGAVSALLAAAWGQGSLRPTSAAAQETIDYLKQVKPILVGYCYECHGPDVENRESDLRLDQKESAFADLGGYRTIVPGDPGDSELYLRISAEIAEERMPPYDAGTELTAEQIETLRKWIEQGAEWVDEDDE